MSSYFDLELFDAQVERGRTTARRRLIALFALSAMACAGVAYGLMKAFGLFPVGRGVVALVAGPIIAAITWGAGLGFLSTVTGAFAAFLHPGGARGGVSTSAAEALFVAGRYDEAAQAFEALRATHGPRAPLFRAEADLQLRPTGDVQRARALLVRLRQAEDATRADELYATQRLIDLYLGPLADETRAMVELRRVVARFPDTPDAVGARRELDRRRVRTAEAEANDAAMRASDEARGC